jgi:hypothetical protein
MPHRYPSPASRPVCRFWLGSRRAGRLGLLLLLAWNLGATDLFGQSSPPQNAPTDQTRLASPGPERPWWRRLRRKRGRGSRGAEIGGTGQVQIEYGYDGSFNAPDTPSDHTGTATLVGSLTEKLQLQLDLDAIHGQVDAGGRRSVGMGDLFVETQYSIGAESPNRPAFALAYRVKAPTAGRNLGSGRFDHRVTGLVSRKFDRTDADLNVAVLLNGCAGAGRRQIGIQAAAGVSRELNERISLQADLFGETLDSDEPRGLFLQGGVAALLSGRVSLDGNVRIGLDPNAPKWGVQGGMVFTLRH